MILHLNWPLNLSNPLVKFSNFAAKISQLDFTFMCMLMLTFTDIVSNRAKIGKRFAKKREIVLLHGKTPSSRPKIALYRVFHIKGPKIIAYSSKNRSLKDFQSLQGAHQMLSI